MLKRIFSGIILCFMLFTVSNKKALGNSNGDITKTLVCVVGNDYKELLEYDGYEIISGGVNFNSEGNYYITYMNKETKETLTKKVSVINTNRVFEKAYFDIEEFNILSNNYDIIDVFEYNSCYYFLEEEKLNETNINIILTKVENEKVIFSKVVKENIDGSVNNIQIDDSGIYISGIAYSNLYNYDLYVSRVSFDGVLENENIIIGNSLDLLKGSFISGEYIYLYGNTKSNGGMFEGIREKEDSLIVKINKNLLQVEKLFINSCPYINEFNFGCVYEDKVYLIEQYVSTEDNLIVKYRTHVYDQNLNLLNIYDIVNSYFLTPLNLLVTNDRIMFLTYQYNPIIEKYSSCIFEIENDGKTKLIYEYVEYEENLRLNDIYISEDNKILLLFYDINNNGGLLLSLDKKDILFTLKIENTGEPIKLQNKSFGYISFDRKIINISNIMVKDNRVLINNETIATSNESIINEDFSIYGNYTNEYIHETKDIMFCYHENIYIESDVSILDGGVYDKNLKLEFNGYGKLNDKSILSGYVIEEEGTYVLDLIGKDNIHKTYRFEVKDLSSLELKKKVQNKLININVNSNSREENLNYKITNNVQEKFSTNYYGLLLIPCILIVLMLILIMRKRHVKKSNI